MLNVLLSGRLCLEGNWFWALNAQMVLLHTFIILLCDLCVRSSGILLCAASDNLNHGQLQPNGGVGKFFSIDHHVHCSACGLMYDAMALIQESQSIAAQYSKKFGTPIPVQRLVSQISEYKQQSTQFYGKRPLGASLVIAGYDKYQGFKLFTTTPGGSRRAQIIPVFAR